MPYAGGSILWRRTTSRRRTRRKRTSPRNPSPPTTKSAPSAAASFGWRACAAPTATSISSRPAKKRSRRKRTPQAGGIFWKISSLKTRPHSRILHATKFPRRTISSASAAPGPTSSPTFRPRSTMRISAIASSADLMKGPRREPSAFTFVRRIARQRSASGTVPRPWAGTPRTNGRARLAARVSRRTPQLALAAALASQSPSIPGPAAIAALCRLACCTVRTADGPLRSREPAALRRVVASAP